MHCPRCDHPLEPGARLCGRCGERRAAGRAPAGRLPSWSLRPGGERRQLTVMFCDLVDSTRLAARLDPDDLEVVMSAYQETCAAVIMALGGHVAQYRGDGLLVYFSYPRAHGDDAARAIRAGLEILSDLRALNLRLEREHGTRLSVRIGVHTGSVVVGETADGRGEVVAVGQAPNVAARIQGLAIPGAILISEATRRLARGHFLTREMGTHALRGLPEPVQVHRVLGTSELETPMERALAEGLTPLVARGEPLEHLIKSFGAVSAGPSRALLIEGEAGMGKSRLLLSLRERLKDTPHFWIETRAAAHRQYSPLHPITALLRGGLTLSPDEAPLEQFEKIERAVEQVGLSRERSAPVLASLLSLPVPEPYVRPQQSAAAERRAVFEILLHWTEALSAQTPVVLVVEDLHWADPSTLDLLRETAARGPRANVLLIGTLRPPFDPEWSARAPVERIALGPLRRSEVQALVGSVRGAEPLPPEVRDRIATISDGVPLYAEEVTRYALERWGEPGAPSSAGARGALLRELEIPATLEDPLRARLDQMGDHKWVAQMGAICGRSFSFALLCAAAGRSGEPLSAEAGTAQLGPGLAELTRLGLAYRQGELPQARFTFKHALIHEAAYRSQRRTERAQCHARIAFALEAQILADARPEDPEELARHFEAGGLTERAVQYYSEAGTRAAERFAHREAIAHFRAAIRVLQKLPCEPGRDVRELALQVGLGASYVAAHGWGSAGANEAYARARQLSGGAEDRPELFLAIRGATTFYTSSSELDTAAELAGSLERMAERLGDAPSRLLAHQHRAIILYFQGQPEAALEHYRQALALYDPLEHRSLTSVYGEELGAFTRIWMAWALWMRGEPSQALECTRAAIELAREAAHPFSLAYALVWAAIVHLMRRELEPSRVLCAEAIALAAKQEFGFVETVGRVTHALARMEPEAADDAHEAARQDLREALSGLPEGLNQVGSALILGLLAERELARGELEAARGALALTRVRMAAPPYWRAELTRLEGEIAEQSGESAEAERLLREALQRARSQGARALELRAAHSLARWLCARGRGAEARAELEPIATKLCDPADPELRAARAQLREQS